MSDIFSNKGPETTYQPYVGKGFISADPLPQAKTSSYANLGILQTQLQAATATAQDLINTFTQTLSVLSVNADPNDATLWAAIQQTYPTSLGSAPNFITFGYYQYLDTVNSSAANYIRQVYESGLQDIGGNDAIDLLPLVNLISQELSLINDFTSNNISTLNDSSEHRIVESFQDFISAANTHLSNIQTIFASQTQPLPDQETSLLSPTDAQSSQALFKVNVNKLNAQINQDQQTLHTNFTQHANTFYTNFLGPALNFRQNVSSQLLPVYPGALGAHLSASIKASNTNLQSILIDQTNRNYFFANQITDLLTEIQQRDQYRDYILQFSTQGGTVPPAGEVLAVTDDITATQFFNAAASPPPATPSFSASHLELADVALAQAHPQYLLASGGDITGPITMDPGATIDGIIPHAHAHNGADGSAQINGSSIIAGTLVSQAVNTSVLPDVPTNFEVIGITINYLGGIPLATVFLAWDGDSNAQFEIQSSLL